MGSPRDGRDENGKALACKSSGGGCVDLGGERRRGRGGARWRKSGVATGPTLGRHCSFAARVRTDLVDLWRECHFPIQLLLEGGAFLNEPRELQLVPIIRRSFVMLPESSSLRSAHLASMHLPLASIGTLWTEVPRLRGFGQTPQSFPPSFALIIPRDQVLLYRVRGHA